MRGRRHVRAVNERKVLAVRDALGRDRRQAEEGLQPIDHVRGGVLGEGIVGPRDPKGAGHEAAARREVVRGVSGRGREVGAPREGARGGGGGGLLELFGEEIEARFECAVKVLADVLKKGMRNGGKTRKMSQKGARK